MEKVKTQYPTTTIVNVTPAIATAWLATTKSNRPIMDNHVRKLASDMKKGLWVYNGDTICFDKMGQLVDGQHRLSACIAVDYPFLATVVYGLEEEAQQTIDIGSRRTAGQILAMAGIPNGSITTSICKLILTYENNGNSLVNSTDSGAPSQAEVAKYAKENWETLEAIGSILAARRFAGMGPGSVAGFCHYEFSKVSPVLADMFFEKLVNGGEPNTSPLFHLREILIRSRSHASRQRLTRIYAVAITIKAWNAFVHNKEISVLRWRTNSEPPEVFPTIKAPSDVASQAE